MSYGRVTWEDRIKIKLLLQQGKSNAEIGRVIGKDKSAIGRELKRNSCRSGYRTIQAQALADSPEALKHQPYVLTDELDREITKRLKKSGLPSKYLIA
jgi:IS30 family transposase